MKRNGELGHDDDLKLPVRPILASVSEGTNYEYEGEIWSNETDDGNNTMQESIDRIRPYFNQDPTDPTIHDTVTKLFNVTKEYNHLMRKESTNQKDKLKELCHYVKWRVLLFTLHMAKVRGSDTDTPPIASD